MTYEEGYDISHWQGVIQVSPMVQAQPPRRFIFIKFTEGTGWKDPRRFENVKKIVEGTTFFWGPYHFFRPAYNSVLQAENFLTQVALSPYVPTLEYAVDVEVTDGLQMETVDRRLRAMLKELLKTLQPQQIAIYSRKYFFDYISKDPWYSQFKLWNAHYRDTGPYLVCSAWTRVGKTWDYLQYTSKLPGGAHGVESTYIDGDRARSLPQAGPTLEELVDALVREARAKGWNI